jgi:hypothetical protein
MLINNNEKLSPHTNILLVLGKEPQGIYHIPMQDDEIDRLLKSFLTNDQGNSGMVFGLHLSLKKEILGYLANLIRLPDVKGSLKWFITNAAKRGLRVCKCVAVLPDVTSPRFCFDYEDSSTHRFLINDILFPRRYSLTMLTRFLLHVYKLCVNKLSMATFLYRGIYVRLEIL